MKRILSALFLFVLAAGVVRVSGRVNPYKDGTPGLTANAPN